MEIPKYIKEKIHKRANFQSRANILTKEIDEYFRSRGIELEYTDSHICLLTEPNMVAYSTIEKIEKGDKKCLDL